MIHFKAPSKCTWSVFGHHWAVVGLWLNACAQPLPEVFAVCPALLPLWLVSNCKGKLICVTNSFLSDILQTYVHGNELHAKEFSVKKMFIMIQISGIIWCSDHLYASFSHRQGMNVNVSDQLMISHLCVVFTEREMIETKNLKAPKESYFRSWQM